MVAAGVLQLLQLGNGGYFLASKILR